MLANARFHHLGVAVASIDMAKPFYQRLGYEVSTPVIETVQKVRVCYARKEGFPTVELLEPLNEASPVSKVLQRNGGNTPYHVCYEVADIHAAVREMREHGFLSLGRPIPGHGLDDALMVFCFSRDVGLIQLMESK